MLHMPHLYDKVKKKVYQNWQMANKSKTKQEYSELTKMFTSQKNGFLRVGRLQIVDA